MLFSPVYANLHLRRSRDFFFGQSPIPWSLPPNPFGITSIADPHPLNPIESYRSKKGVGGRGLETSPNSAFYFLPSAFTHPLSFQSPTHSFERFCTYSKKQLFYFQSFAHTLSMQPGVGVPSFWNSLVSTAARPQIAFNYPLSPQSLTKCSSRNSFVFKLFHFCPGVYPPATSFSDRGKRHAGRKACYCAEGWAGAGVGGLV